MAVKASKGKVGRPVESENRGETYALAEYLSENLNTRTGMTNQEIAEFLGYEKANIIPMWKTGKTRIPLDRLGDLAKILRVDTEQLLGMWFEQYVAMHYKTGKATASGKNNVDERRRKVKEISGYFTRVASKAEYKVVEAIREHTDGKPDLSRRQLEAISMVAASTENAEKAFNAMTGRD